MSLKIHLKIKQIYIRICKRSLNTEAVTKLLSWHQPPILTVKSWATMQFLAARSLWTNFLAFKYAMPSAISAAIWIISFRVGGGRPGLFCRICSVVTQNGEFLKEFFFFLQPRVHDPLNSPVVWCLSSNRPVSCYFPYMSFVYLHTGNDQKLKVTFLQKNSLGCTVKVYIGHIGIICRSCTSASGRRERK